MVCVSSFAGIAAILLPLGQTCHRTYGLPLDVQEKRSSILTTRSAGGRRLAHASVHIIDEFECFHKNLFEEASAVTTRCVNDQEVVGVRGVSRALLPGHLRVQAEEGRPASPLLLEAC